MSVYVYPLVFFIKTLLGTQIIYHTNYLFNSRKYLKCVVISYYNIIYFLQNNFKHLSPVPMIRVQISKNMLCCRFSCWKRSVSLRLAVSQGQPPPCIHAPQGVFQRFTHAHAHTLPHARANYKYTWRLFFLEFSSGSILSIILPIIIQLQT